MHFSWNISFAEKSIKACQLPYNLTGFVSKLFNGCEPIAFLRINLFAQKLFFCIVYGFNIMQFQDGVQDAR